MIEQLPSLETFIRQDTDYDCGPKAMRGAIQFSGIPITPDLEEFLGTLMQLAGQKKDNGKFRGTFLDDFVMQWGAFAQAHYRRGHEPFTFGVMPEVEGVPMAIERLGELTAHGEPVLLATINPLTKAKHVKIAFRNGSNAEGAVYRVVSPNQRTEDISARLLASQLRLYPHHPMLVIHRNGKH